jgi:cytochrome c oxidase subunit II
MTIIIVLVSILVLVILGLMLRTLNLLDIFGGNFRKRVSLSNSINAIIFPITFVVGFALIIWSSWDASKDFLPEASSIHGRRIDQSFWITMAVIGFVFVLTHILLFLFPFQYQFKENRKAYFYPDNNKLEVLWTVIPAIVLSTLIFSGWKVWADVTADAPKDAYAIEIVGKQFNWIVRYAGADSKIGKHNFRKIDATNSLGMDFEDPANFDDFEANEIHFVVNKPVLLKIRARDVLHSVFMPHFRVKMDAVPGMPTRFWFVPDKTTAQMREETGNPNFTYELACTEVCGRNHFGMRKVIIVEEEEEYLAWFNSQQSFLAKNPDYIKQVPDKYKAQAELQLPKAPAATPAGEPAQATTQPATVSSAPAVSMAN